jgi:histidine decarboxylase
MWIKRFFQRADKANYQFDDFKALLSYINYLAQHKLGYPVSLMTYLGVLDNRILGIRPGSLANVLLNNVGDPFKDSETSLMEVKRHERELISILETYYGLPKDQARGYVTTGGTEGNFAGLWWSKRYLINSSLAELIRQDDKIKLQLKEEQTLNAELAKIPLNNFQSRAEHLQKIIDIRESIVKDREVVQELLTPTVFYAKGHTHYSVPKIAEILRLNIRAVEPDKDGAMDLGAFKRDLIVNLGAHPHSAVVVIANIGTTITGAVDNVPEIKKIIESMRPSPLYSIHLDGALTGFVMPVVKPFGETVKNYFDDIGVNTLAVSAHKYPGLSQPCGIILARRAFFEKAFEKSERSIDYVGNILDVTITGSRSGLNVLMFYNALYTFEMHKGTKKLEKMVSDNLSMARYLYNELVKIYGKDKVYYPYHFNVMFPRPSAEMAKKYQLMLTGERATICVLTNVTKLLVDQFIQDLKDENARMEGKPMTTENQEYTLQNLTEQTMKSATDLFTRTFCESEPITKHLNVQPVDYIPFAKEVMQKAVKDGLSKVLVDKQQHVVAVCVAEDIADPFIPKLSHYPKLRPIVAILDELSRPFLEDKIFSKGKIAHCWIAAVAPELHGKKLSVMIDTGTTDALARKGYDYVYCEFTNPLSEKIVSHYNSIQQMNKVTLDNFVLDKNIRPFAGLPGAVASYILVIRPGVKIESLENCYKVEVKY